MQGPVMEEFNKKSAVMKTMESGSGDATMLMTFEIPTANLIGAGQASVEDARPSRVEFTFLPLGGRAEEQDQASRERLHHQYWFRQSIDLQLDEHPGSWRDLHQCR